ncbi:MAG: hypothetical protein M1817_003162 [Caeruleum heppii]|nr:MAG: hypothetical protein M1817_003162 [Caeruleum heppii]
MPSNKDRLFVALYYHQRPSVFHWAFLVSPKSKLDEPNATTRYHVTNKVQARGDSEADVLWHYERLELPKVRTVRLLVRVLVGKIESSRAAFEASLASVALIQHNPEWTCRQWAVDALAQLARDGVLSKSSITDWPTIEQASRDYEDRKKREGQFDKLSETIPTYDLITKREMIA